jgi:hypothetical protein
MLNRVLVLWAGHFEKFLKMIFGWPCLTFEVTFGYRYTLFTKVAGSLTVAAVAGYYNNVMGSLLLPFLATLDAFSITLNGGLGWYGSATTSSRFRVA